MQQGFGVHCFLGHFVSQGSQEWFPYKTFAIARIARIAEIEILIFLSLAIAARIAKFYGFHMIARIAQHFFLRSLRSYPASRVAFDFPRKIGKIESDSARRVCDRCDYPDAIYLIRNNFSRGNLERD